VWQGARRFGRTAVLLAALLVACGIQGGCYQIMMAGQDTRSLEQVREDQKRLKERLAEYKALRAQAWKDGDYTKASMYNRWIRDIQEDIDRNDVILTFKPDLSGPRTAQNAATNVQAPRAPMPRPGHHHPE
jgi:hypothetical protein